MILDKLVSRALKGESSTVGDVRYTGKEILGHFLEEILKMIRAETKKETVDRIVVAVRRYDSKMLEILESCADRLGIPAERMPRVFCTTWSARSARSGWGRQECLTSPMRDSAIMR